MSLAMQGTWTVAIKSKNAALPQRVTVSGAASGNFSHIVTSSSDSFSRTVTGAHWTVTIESQTGSTWNPSAMRFKTPVRSGGLISVDIESNDTGPDQDFNDLIITCTLPDSGADFVLYGHASAYSGPCIFNPCWRYSLVIDGVLQLEQALKNPIARAALEKLYPEQVLPGLKNPPDPGPDTRLKTFTPLMLPTPRAAALPPRAYQVTRGLEANTSRQLLVSANAAPQMLDTGLTAKLGGLQDGFSRYPLHCRSTVLANYGLRFQEYDRTAAELSGGAYTGTGAREDLGSTATDIFGNYLFRFSRSFGDVVDEVLNDVAVGEDANVQALPDIIAQVLGAGAIPAAETACHFNVQTLQRIDICVPDTNIVLPSSCANAQILTFIGKISMTSAQNSLDATGRITAHSTAGNAPQIDCGVWWGNLDLWGCFGNPSIAWYTVRTRPLGGDASSWTLHAQPESREQAGGTAKGIGPFFDLQLAVPLAPTSPAKVYCPRYANAETDGSIVQPGAFLKATLFTAGFVPGSYEVRIDAYSAAGDLLRGESHTLFIDNTIPDVRVGAITLAGVPVVIDGNGCTLQTLSPAELNSNLDVRFIVDHPEGAILNYALGVSRCNEGVGFPVSYVSGGQPSFTWVHDNGHTCEEPPNFRRGTIEDPDNDGSGFVTSTLAPLSPWLGPDENFTIMRVGIAFNWRATDGYANASGTSRGPWVWGIQK